MPRERLHEYTILWAVDPFEKTDDAVRSGAWMIRALVKETPARVLPVYLNGASKPALIPDGSWQNYAESRLADVLERVPIPGIEPLFVPPRLCSGTRDGVNTLLELAQDEEADLLVVATHGQGGIKRWVMGSFAETLVLHSKLPTLTVHPTWRRLPEFKTVLFPTDFSEASKAAYEKLLDFARAHDSRVVLFHKLHYPEFPLNLDVPMVAATLDRAMIESESKRLREIGLEWARYAASKGVRAKLLLDTTFGGSITQAILKRARRFACMIAIAAKSDALQAVLLGSISRRLVRESELPVWAIHVSAPKAKRPRRVA